MSSHVRIPLLSCSLFLIAASLVASDAIPAAAWKRGIGVPLENPGTKDPRQNIIDDGYWQGAPVGGFGAGTFSHTYRGDFARWHIKGGVHKYKTVYGNQFIVYQKAEGDERGFAQVLFNGHPPSSAMKSWQWDYPAGAGDYYALYPKAWYDYRHPKFPARLVVEQFSPILPGNYKETSYPVAVYQWHASNPTNKKVTVSIMLTWENMIGWFRGFSHDFNDRNTFGETNRFRAEAAGSAQMKGIIFDRQRRGPVTEDWDGQWAIGALETPGVEISYFTTFCPDRDGSDVWAPFAKDGRLANDDTQWLAGGETVAGAIAIRFTLDPGAKLTVPMVIAWDLPIVQFGGGRKWYRHYTDFFGTSGTNAWEIARTGLAQANEWSAAIDAWQTPYINDESKPLWYRSMLFNETYIIADGGSFWGREVEKPTDATPVFSYLNLEYNSYSPLDVIFYASMPVIRFWPELDKLMLRQVAEAVPKALPERGLWDWESERTGKLTLRVRKAKGSVPHTLGNALADPFYDINQGNWQDSNRFKDLNSKFVLMIWRDFKLTGSKDVGFLHTTWPAVQDAIKYLEQFDRDGDFIPENEGYPDQTYDDWPMKGTSAYCGGLYLAALRAAEEIGKALNEPLAAAAYRAKFARAQPSYIKKLWNGEYFRYDTESEYRENIHSDQLAGQWYANLTGLGDLVPREMRRSALKKVFDFNVMKFDGGRSGPLNGMGADGTIIKTNDQVHEVWPGTAFAVASEMIAEGMRDEAFKTIEGVYRTIYETKGYWFRTPEAWISDGYFRAGMYMRPAAIWAMEMVPAPR